MEPHHMNSFYAAIVVVCTFCVAVIVICYKLAKQTNQLEEKYSPCRIQPHSGAKLRKPKYVAYKASVGTPTTNVEQLYAVLKKETVSSEQLGSSEPPCKTCVTDNKVVNQEEPELYSNSEHFYQNPSLAYECVADIHRPSAKYTSLPTKIL